MTTFTNSQSGDTFEVAVLLSSTSRIDRTIVLFINALEGTFSYYVMDDSIIPPKQGISD